MPLWIPAAGSFFAYIAVTAGILRGLNRRQRLLAGAGAAAGLAASAYLHVLPHVALLHDWVAPPLILLLAYWTSGLLFVAPMSGIERVLEGIDRALRVDAVARATPRWAAETLELAYAGVYPLIPLALAISLLTVEGATPGRFWTVVLVTDFICFGCLPWIQTRPPRSGRAADPWPASLRRYNIALLGRTSIQVNTFPSGHAAEALAAALLVSCAPWPVAAAIWLAAALVSAGTVFGRYHYAADVLTGWAVALAVWALAG